MTTHRMSFGMLYLLHFDPPVGRAQHYLGYTTPENLALRMTTHARGHGAALTRRAFEQGSKVYFARTFPDQDKHTERRLKQAGHMKRLCPLCCEALARMKSEVYEIDPKRPDRPPARPVLGWQSSPRVP